MFTKLYHILVLKINNFFRFVSYVENDPCVVPKSLRQHRRHTHRASALKI